MPDEARPADQSRSGIGFVFGALDAEAVPGPIVVQLMSVLGVAEPTTRQLLARMLRQGDLSRQRAGRVSVYRLDGRYLQQWLRLRHGDGPVPWPGAFQLVLHDLPERYRQHRENLLGLASRAGFGQLRPGVLVGLDRPGFVPDLLASPGWPADAGLVETGRLDVDPVGARRIAETAWRLAARAADLRQAGDALEQVLREVQSDSGDGVAATQRLFRAIQLAGGPRYNAPLLPPELLPTDWPSDQVQHLLMTVVRQLQPQVGEFLYQQLLRSPHAPLIRGGWWPALAAGRPLTD